MARCRLISRSIVCVLPVLSVVRMWLVGIVVALLAHGCGSEPPATQSDAANAPPAAAVTREEQTGIEREQRTGPSPKDVNRILDSRVQLELNDTPLEDALAIVSQLESVEFDFDDEAFRTAGVSKDESVTLSAKGIPLSEALTSILEPLGLTYIVDDHRIRITAAASDAASPE